MQHEAFRDIWETYTTAWSEPDNSKRFELFKKSLLADCIYCDPLVNTSGYKELTDYIGELHHNVPGVRFVTKAFISHHNQSLAHWDMTDALGNVLATGASYGQYGDNGLLQRMAGFYQIPAS